MNSRKFGWESTEKIQAGGDGSLGQGIGSVCVCWVDGEKKGILKHVPLIKIDFDQTV